MDRVLQPIRGRKGQGWCGAGRSGRARGKMAAGEEERLVIEGGRERHRHGEREISPRQQWGVTSLGRDITAPSSSA
ncbi:hypothetical protein chiPu_0022663 [Chiloscyllium punctatum]|uniref:Uncharacterized protein n=1 Tax=Chiloscyllium punctatum TaxID=137246 RepID=A0A401RJE5_CHIPU|nr:hypothetical protein [Chiloscyllium punctatum]